MIVKNEETFIRDCLESVKDAADEIIIVDTGSTDNTIAIAREYNSKIYHFDWIKDFSAARNYALSKSTGTWVLYLDADERLSKSSVALLKKIISKEEKSGYKCEVISRNSFNNSAQVMYYTRLFYNSPAINFSGAIHEQIDASLIENDYRLYNSDIVIEHLGYDLPENELKKKAERNLSYLLKEYSCNSSSYNAYQTGNTYQILGDDEKAFFYYQKSLTDPFLPDEYKSICCLNIASYLISKHQPDEAAHYIEKGIIANEELPQLYLLSSQINYRQGNVTKALENCISAIEFNNKIKDGKHKTHRILSTFDNRKPIYHGIFLALSMSELNWVNRFIQALRLVDDSEAALIQKLLSNQDISDHEKHQLIKIVNSENIQCILSILERINCNDMIKFISESLIKKFPENSKLLTFMGNYNSRTGNKKLAKMYYERALEVKDNDASAAFYLISLLIELNQWSKIPYVLSKAEKEFEHIPEVKERMSVLKQKLQTILQTLES